MSEEDTREVEFSLQCKFREVHCRGLRFGVINLGFLDFSISLREEEKERGTFGRLATNRANDSIR